MPATLTEWRALTAALSKPQQEAVRFHLNAQVAVARDAQTAVDHPGWQTFVDHLTTVKAAVDRKAEALRGQIVGEDTLGDDLVKMKLAYRELLGESQGLQQALDLIPGLIAAGERARATLNPPSNPA